MNRYLIVALVAAVFVLGVMANHYRDRADKWRDEYRAAYQVTQQQAKTLTHMQTRQRDVAALDQKYTQELADAKQTIADLRRDVDDGKRRLQLNATCGHVSATATATRMADDATARLTPVAEQHYWRLREQLATADRQIAGLQDYIRQQCLKHPTSQ